MTPPRPTRNRAFSYRRFSTPEQRQGDSIRRQEDAAARYCTSNGLVLDDELQLLDPGRSAFKGKHLDPEKSALGKFVALAEAGRLPKDAAALLCDDVSRLTRLGWLESANLLSRILQTGLDVVFTDSGERVTKANFARLSGALTYLLKAETSHQESADKARKLEEVWQAHRDQARESGRLFTRMLPAWIEVHGSKLAEVRGVPTRTGGKLRLVPARAKVVKEIFTRYAAGEGKRVIVRELNGRGEPTWGAVGTGREPIAGQGRKAGVHWAQGYVHKILRSPAAMGTWIPKRRGEAQPPIRDYFPAAVSEELWQRVQALIATARSPGRGNTTVVNPLATIARCCLCGAALTKANSGPGKGGPRLVCTRAKAGLGCSYRSVPMRDVENALRGHIDLIAGSRPITDYGLAGQVIGKEEELADVTAKLQKLGDMVLSGEEMPRTMLDRMRELEKRQSALAEEIAELQRRLAHAEGDYIVNRVNELVKVLRRADAPAREVNAALRGLFGSIVVDYQLRVLECRWAHMPDGAPLVLPMDLDAKPASKKRMRKPK